MLVYSISLSVFASSVIDRNRLGSISADISASYSGTGYSLSGIKFSVYEVAELTIAGTYSLTIDFSGSGVSLSNLSTASAVSNAAKSLVSYALSRNISGKSSITNSSGVASFVSLPLGCYLVAQTDILSNSDIDIDSDPFLVNVPMTSTDGKNWVYDITAYPKSETVSGAVILEKKDSLGSSLSGAVFNLDKKIYYTAGSGILPNVPTYSDSKGDYYWKAVAVGLTSDSNGQIAVSKLSYGHYRFAETSAPSGYLLNAVPYEFYITESGSIALSGGKYAMESGSVQKIIAVNSKNPTVPPGVITVYNPSNSNTLNPTSGTDIKTFPSAQPSAVPFDGMGAMADRGSSSADPDNPDLSGASNMPNSSRYSGFSLPRTDGSLTNAVSTYGGIALVICGLIVFIVTRRKKNEK